MKLNVIKDNAGATQYKTRVGRGIGSGKGKQAGRGGKGQTARSGVRIKGFEGGQMPLHRRLPKRGFNAHNPLDLNPINLDRLQQAFDSGLLTSGATITEAELVKAGVISKPRDGVKILGRGEIKAKAAFEVHSASKTAIAAIEKAGGSVKVKEVVEAPAKKAPKKA